MCIILVWGMNPHPHTLPAAILPVCNPGMSVPVHGLTIVYIGKPSASPKLWRPLCPG